MENLSLNNWINKGTAVSLMWALLYGDAFASRAGSSVMTSGLEKFANIITGPFAFYTALTLFAVLGFMMFFGEWSSSMMLLIKGIFSLTIVFGGASILGFLYGAGAIF